MRNLVALAILVLASCSEPPAPVAVKPAAPQPKWMTEDFSRKTTAAVTATAPDPDLKPYVPTKGELAAAAKIGVLPPPEKPQFVLAPLNIPEPKQSEWNRLEMEKDRALARKAAEEAAANERAMAEAERERLVQEENNRRAIEARQNAETLATAIRDAARIQARKH
jgi:hypothetical protein